MYRILLVDDEVWVLESLKTSVDWARHGFAIAGQATNGLEALELIRKLKPDAVFSDVRMPGMNGLELIKSAREQGLTAEFVFASGYAEFAYAQKAINYGALGYCLKPFDEAEIASVLARVRQKLDGPAAPKQAPPRDGEPAGDGREGATTIERIVEHIDRNSLSNITIQGISQLFYMNPNYLSHLFKKETGQTFTEYVTGKRIAHAAALLRDTRLAVGEVGVRSGYQDCLYFTRIFKKATGMTPSEYRASAHRP